jgi:proto-oncogene tyrosine-protein kinase Ret
VHADLAARNVLLDQFGIAKISDFGMSKKLYESNTYVKKTKVSIWVLVSYIPSHLICNDTLFLISVNFLGDGWL